MRFGERELNPYAEPVSTSELQEGSVCFAVNYVPGDMLIPIMETLVFIGRNLEAGDVGKVYFQDVGSHRQGIRYDAGSTDESEGHTATDVRGSVFSGSESQVFHVFEFELALDNLIRCSLRRMNLDTEITVRFEGRELKPHAEPVSASELREGSVYFALNYVDDERLIPVMDTRVFIGRNLEADDEGKAYFQDVDSHRDGVRYDPADKDNWATFYVDSENELHHIFEYEQALEELMKCSLRRRKV